MLERPSSLSAGCDPGGGTFVIADEDGAQWPAGEVTKPTLGELRQFRGRSSFPCRAIAGSPHGGPTFGETDKEKQAAAFRQSDVASVDRRLRPPCEVS